MAVKDYLRERFFPHMWCPGCGHGTILNSLIRAVEELQLNKNEIVMTSGIGCSARISGYVDFHSLHTLHGRALAFATGVKLSRPNLTVLVPMGDGDALAIGGNHFIHAARRNLDMTAVVMNNRIYGMTGGQFSPLTGIEVSASRLGTRQMPVILASGPCVSPVSSMIPAMKYSISATVPVPNSATVNSARPALSDSSSVVTVRRKAAVIGYFSSIMVSSFLVSGGIAQADSRISAHTMQHRNKRR